MLLVGGQGHTWQLKKIIPHPSPDNWSYCCQVKVKINVHNHVDNGHVNDNVDLNYAGTGDKDDNVGKGDDHQDVVFQVFKQLCLWQAKAIIICLQDIIWLRLSIKGIILKASDDHAKYIDQHFDVSYWCGGWWNMMMVHGFKFHSSTFAGVDFRIYNNTKSQLSHKFLTNNTIETKVIVTWVQSFEHKVTICAIKYHTHWIHNSQDYDTVFHLGT